MDFTTRFLNPSNIYEFNWYRMYFREDFVNLLKMNGQLPFDSINQAIKVKQENEANKRTIEALRQENSEKDEEIAKLKELLKLQTGSD